VHRGFVGLEVSCELGAVTGGGNPKAGEITGRVRFGCGDGRSTWKNNLGRRCSEGSRGQREDGLSYANLKLQTTNQ